MTMRCRFHLTCDIDCPHHAPHEHNKFCDRDGMKATCSGGDDPYCVPESKLELAIDILRNHLTPDGAVEVAKELMEKLGIEEAA